MAGSRARLFGLAKVDDDGLTQNGDILGTIRYMAPERFRGSTPSRSAPTAGSLRATGTRPSGCWDTTSGPALLVLEGYSRTKIECDYHIAKSAAATPRTSLGIVDAPFVAAFGSPTGDSIPPSTTCNPCRIMTETA